MGGEILKRLARFTKALETTDDLASRFTVRTVRTMAEPTDYSAELVKQTRHILRASQAVFACFLGVSRAAVRDWEQGSKSPNGSARRMMDEIRRDPDYWTARFHEMAGADR